MRSGQALTKVNDRGATFTTRGGVLWHEEAKPIDRRRLAACADVLVTWPKIAGSRKRARAVYPTTRARKRKGEGKHSVNEVTNSLQSHRPGLVGTSASHISRIIQDDTLDRVPSPCESCETGHVLTAVWHKEPFRQSQDWLVCCAHIGGPIAPMSMCALREIRVDRH